LDSTSSGQCPVDYVNAVIEVKIHKKDEWLGQLNEYSFPKKNTVPTASGV
jgi:hypothetical protein